ncbi:MAG TPA: archease [Terriglobia bacterium]|nr:archease [Terriglobia bacterium]
MMPFRVLEHTADVGFEALGNTREEVFGNAARALTDLMVDLPTIRPAQEVSIEVSSSSAANLLVDWLSEILYRYDAESWLFCDFTVTRLSDQALAAVARGEKFDPVRHRIKLLVKAVTYHQLVLENARDGWRAQVYVDI